MKKTSDIIFDQKTREWNVYLESKECVVFVAYKGKQDLRFSFSATSSSKSKQELVEYVKNSTAFKESMEQIKNWEEKMKEELEIGKVEIVGKEQRGEKEMYLFAFQIESLLTTKKINLGKTKEEILKDFFYVSEFELNNAHFYFILPLEKRIENEKIDFVYDKNYPLSTTWVNQDNQIEINLEELETKRALFGENLYITHTGFIEDVVEKVKNAPSIRLKKIIM